MVHNFGFDHEPSSNPFYGIHQHQSETSFNSIFLSSSIKFVSCKNFYLNLNSVLITKFVFFSSSLQLKKDFFFFLLIRVISTSGTWVGLVLHLTYGSISFFCVVCEQFTPSMRGGGKETWIKFTNCLWRSSTCDGREIAKKIAFLANQNVHAS